MACMVLFVGEQTMDASFNDVSLDDIALAEQVLQRLIHEKKALENGAKVLAAYRQAVASLQTAHNELTTTQESLETAQHDLQYAESTKTQRLKEIHDQYEEYKINRNTETQTDINVLLANRTLLMVEKSNLESSINELKHEYKIIRDNQAEEYLQVEAALDKMKVQHAALSEAINNAALLLR